MFPDNEIKEFLSLFFDGNEKKIDNEYQKIGELNAFIRFSLSMLKSEKNWYQGISNQELLSPFDLEAIELFG